ncbi:hypothetical protein [Actinophytocola sp.]|uniref:hypothetical protein n=1 Tax=Actinophytocola sp. TaxID=1872138 RepID=UPI003899CFFD
MKVVARVVAGLLGVLVSLLALGYVGNLLQDNTSPAARLRDSAGEPWVRHDDSLTEALARAAERTTGKLSVAMTFTVRAASRDEAGTRLSMSVTGPADDPVVRAIREGRARGNGAGLALLFGVYPHIRGSLAYEEPRTTVRGAVATVTVDATGTLATGDTTRIAVYPTFDMCDRLARRTITIAGSGMLVSSVSAVEPGWEGSCSHSGVWQSQSPTRAVFVGPGEADIELIRAADAGPADPNRREPLLAATNDLAGLFSTFGFAAIPLFLAWLRLRPGRRSTRREPSLRRWSAENVVGARTATVLGMLLVLQVLVGMGSVLAVGLSTVYERLSAGQGEVGDLVPPVAIAPVALMVALAFGWRRVALRTVLARAGRSLVDVGWLLVSGAVLLAVCGVVWASSDHLLGFQPQLPTGGGDQEWWLTRPGFLVLFLGVLHLAAVVGVLAARWSGAPPRALGWVAWTAPLVVALCFGVVLVQGVFYRPPDDGTAPRTWVEWLTTGDGVWALLLAVLTGLVPVVICLLVWKPGLRRAVRGWPPAARIALGIAVAGTGVLVMYVVLTLVFGTPLLLDSDNWVWLGATPTWTEWYDSAFGRVTALYLATLLAVLGMVVAGRALGVSARTGLTMAAGTAVTAVLLMVMPVTASTGLLADLVGAVVPLTASVFVWLTLDRIVRHAVNADPPQGWRALRPALRRWRGLRVVAALVLSLPFVVSGYDWGPRISWYDFIAFASSIDGALPLIGLFLLVLLLRHLGKADADGVMRGSLSLLRTTTLLIGVVGLLTTSATVVGLPTAFLVGWLLFETWLLPRPVNGAEHPAVGELAEDETAAAVRTIVHNVITARAEGALEKELRHGLAEGAPDAEDQDRRLRRLAELTLRTRGTPQEQQRRALSSYGGASAWQRAREFALLGFIAGLPWTVLDIAAVFGTLTGGGPFRLVDAAAGVLVILRFAIAGLVMGGAYPLIRGATGLGKGLSLFVALAGPALCVTLLPDPRANDALAGALLQLAQWLSFGLVVGLAADWLTLRRHGYGLRHLRELHRMNALTASASTLLLAVLTATATAVGTGAAGVFVDRVLTPAPAVAPPVQATIPDGG